MEVRAEEESPGVTIPLGVGVVTDERWSMPESSESIEDTCERDVEGGGD